MAKYNFDDLTQLSVQEFRSVIDSVRPRIYTYRYVWKTEDGLNLKYVSDVRKVHEEIREGFQKDDKVISCLCEYVGEIDPSIVSFQDIIKSEVVIKKEDLEDEALS